MQVDNIFYLKSGVAIMGSTPWRDNVTFKKGDILSCDDKSWEVVDVDHIYQGCFGEPISRMHALKIKPINHDSFPEKNNVLVKQ